MEILKELSNTGAVMVVIIAGLISVSCVASMVLAVKQKAASVFFFFLVIATLFAGITYTSVVDATTPRYEVIIHDIDEFDFEKYRVLRSDGRVFTIKEVR